VERARQRAGKGHDQHAVLPVSFATSESARPLLERSLRAHRLLQEISHDCQLDALALNCHSDVLRWSDDPGVVACLGSTLLWSSGVPVACTGDAVTAVVLMLAARISGSAQYCEGYAIEAETGELLISSCGMADASLCAAGSSVNLRPNDLYPGRHGMGIAARFDFDAGPATIAAFAPLTATSPSRIVVSSGRLTGRGFEHLNGPSGMFTFDRPGAGASSGGLIDAGPAHHLALMRGDRTREFRAAAVFLGAELVHLQGGDAA